MAQYALLAATLGLALSTAGSAFQYPGQTAPGQLPGQMPPDPSQTGSRYPGQYPGGQSPGGGISLPSRGHKKSQKQTDQQQLPTISAEGVTVQNDGKRLLVATADGRTLTMTINNLTKWSRAGNAIAANLVIPRTTVKVVAAEDDEAFLTVQTVDLVKEAPKEEPDNPNDTRPGLTKTPDDEEMARPTILRSPDAPGRPVLRRGVPAVATANDSTASDTGTRQVKEQPSATAKAATPKSDPTDFTIGDEPPPTKKSANEHDQLVEQTREWAQTFTNGLPNFLCQQSTTRYVERSRSEGFEPIDVVTAKVFYEEGHEKYSDITVGGKRTNKSMMEIGGSTSTGEFASVLGGLFSQATRTEFKFLQSTTVSREPAAIFDFKVALRNSDWTIQVGGQTLRPAYSGSIWIDKATAQVRRIEMQADNIPKDFPDDTIASAVDYEEVSLGTSKFLLPVHAENLSCQRGSTICTKNTIDFRDYHKYSGESTIEYK